MNAEKMTTERAQRLFDRIERDKELDRIIEERRAKREAQEEARLRGPALEDIADEHYLRAVIRDPHAVYEDERYRRMQEREQERFDPYAPDPPPAPKGRRRVILIHTEVEVDRGPARSTREQKKPKKKERLRAVSIHGELHYTVARATRATFSNALCNAPLAFEGEARKTRAAECPISANGVAPGVWEIQLLALLTGRARLAERVAEIAVRRGKRCVDGAGEINGGYIRVPFAGHRDLLTSLGRDPEQGRNVDNVKEALAFLKSASVSAGGDAPAITGLIRVEVAPTHRLNIGVSWHWLRWNTSTRGVTYLDLGALMKLRKPTHVNALLALSAWKTTSTPYRSLDKVARWFGIQERVQSRKLDSIKAAVTSVGKTLGVRYRIAVREAPGRVKQVCVYLPKEIR